MNIMPLLKAKNQATVQAIERGCRILDHLSKGKQSYSIQDLSLDLNLPKPTIHRILSTLRQFGLVAQDEISKEYHLGFRLVELGYSVLYKIDLRKVAEPFISQLAALTQETVHLVILDQAEIVYLDKVEDFSGPKSLRMASKIGMRNYAHSCAVGKVLLAFLSDSERDEIMAQKGLPRMTKNTIVNLAQLNKCLADARAQGYAIDNEENEEGVRCIGAPVRNDRGKVIAAISISGPTVRMTKKRIHNELKTRVMKTALEISKKLGYKTESSRERR
jgi:IclR family acetate operon transcriptional repressor